MSDKSEQIRVSPRYKKLLYDDYANFKKDVAEKYSKEVDFTDFTDLLALSAHLNKKLKVRPIRKDKKKLGFSEKEIWIL